ncbi:sulfite exporter TauE/SafE family protein [uncultured Rossellomorea sp.]|uniref:sulfite exporter TauE/SafE family protein n=1 Tax=uncultured Rossellomorea sp. TaxID=2837549 RepID=UPI00262EAFD2|nr:sulfite exporter TauE/SafE family protein [uncultured Rossellomorea sp.]
MRKLIIFALVGFFAQLVDGSLGMAFGLTSSSLLLAYGVAPAVASASIHMSEIATTAASGISHFKFGNVNKRMAVLLLIPGAISAFIGAAFLSNIPGGLIKPYISTFLLILGIYIFIRFLFFSQSGSRRQEVGKKTILTKKRFLFPLGAVAGFFDAIGGGGWGPINTPVLLANKNATPREVVGTVDTSEFVVTIAATLGFVIFLGWEQFNWFWVSAFVIGGVLAAPLAAWLVRILQPYLLGVLVGGFIVLTNLNTLLKAGEVSPGLSTAAYVLVVLGWISGIIYSLVKNGKKQGLHQDHDQATLSH